ncbi:MAG: RagB/SusD family nutrient uptake outer membrane protein [Bacteroidales bacterium]|nr:RagB/SusD family nutrient uptake outer membrane protein [Bacteroidales bacterium]
MNKKQLKISMIGAFALILALASCTKDLDTIPIDPDVVTSATVYKNPESYKQVLAKLYAGLAVSGQQGPHGMGDLSGLDEGFGQYLRAYWYAQELPTDEAIIAWNDGNLRDYHEQDWSASNEFITNLYYRIFYQVSLCNEFLRQSTDDKMKENGISESDQQTIREYRAEARFLRALSYWHALDLFGSVPFVTEKDKVGAFFPKQISKKDLFDYIESELLDIENKLPEPRTNEYGRADQAADWMLLAKLYLNAKVYVGEDHYSDVITYTKKVIDAGYTLDPSYQNLFLADNDQAQGVIFPITFDGVHTKTWGGTTFIIHASVGGSMNPADFGIDGGWAGLRATKQFVGKFMDISNLKSTVVSAKGSSNYPLIFVPGSYQGWNPEDSTTVLASVNSDNHYQGYLYFADANTEFKFSYYPNWDYNFGDNGADGTLDQNGDNIVVPEAGYYKIDVDTTTRIYSVVKTDWGVIGDATADQWDSDQNMTYDPATGLWTVVLELNTGEIKFRANDDWALNYGDNDADGILEEGGSNISIPEAGKYKISLKLGAPDYTYTIEKFASDSRSMFYTDGQSLDIDDMFEFTNGYAITKFKNITSTGASGKDLTFPDTDFPLFRLADAYLMYAEAVLRGGSGGDLGTALGYVNALRERAYGDNSADITADDLTLDFLLDERARELFWEGYRRTDLVRFGKFSNTDYVWAWKGGIKEGKSTDSKYDVFPIPSSDIAANPNLTQNPGY